MNRPLAIVILSLSPAWARAGDEPFAFGVEYLSPGLAKTYAATGATWCKPMPEGFDWNSIEPKPPVAGRHSYNWTVPDALIREYQAAGFRNFHIYTEARNRWTSSKPLPRVGGASFPPKPEHLQDYATYLRSLVERYNGDGKDDMPGLRFPVRYWEIEAEWGTFFPGSVADYLALLRVAHRSIKEADPKGQVILVGFLAMGVFDGDPDDQALARRLADPVHGRNIRKGFQDAGELLKHPDLFDAVEFHSLGDWTEIPATTRWLIREMAKNGYAKPIWAGDINFNLNPMIWWGKPFYPYTAAQKEDIGKWLRALDHKTDRQHEAAVRWFRAEQASFTAKKKRHGIGPGRCQHGQPRRLAPVQLRARHHRH